MNLGVLILLLGCSVGVPLTQLNDTMDQTQFQPLPVSMSMAVQAAEAVTLGQALNAQLELADGRPVYKIYMLDADLSVSRVQVDAQDGEVALVVAEEQDSPKKEQIVHHGQGAAI
jgi:uncharacterized membrane protein YkoI